MSDGLTASRCLKLGGEWEEGFFPVSSTCSFKLVEKDLDSFISTLEDAIENQDAEVLRDLRVLLFEDGLLPKNLDTKVTTLSEFGNNLALAEVFLAAYLVDVTPLPSDLEEAVSLHRQRKSLLEVVDELVEVMRLRRWDLVQKEAASWYPFKRFGTLPRCRSNFTETLCNKQKDQCTWDASEDPLDRCQWKELKYSELAKKIDQLCQKKRRDDLELLLLNLFDASLLPWLPTDELYFRAYLSELSPDELCAELRGAQALFRILKSSSKDSLISEEMRHVHRLFFSPTKLNAQEEKERKQRLDWFAEDVKSLVMDKRPFKVDVFLLESKGLNEDFEAGKPDPLEALQPPPRVSTKPTQVTFQRPPTTSQNPLFTQPTRLPPATVRTTKPLAPVVPVVVVPPPERPARVFQKSTMSLRGMCEDEGQDTCQMGDTFCRWDAQTQVCKLPKTSRQLMSEFWALINEALFEQDEESLLDAVNNLAQKGVDLLTWYQPVNKFLPPQIALTKLWWLAYNLAAAYSLYQADVLKEADPAVKAFWEGRKNPSSWNADQKLLLDTIVAYTVTTMNQPTLGRNAFTLENMSRALMESVIEKKPPVIREEENLPVVGRKRPQDLIRQKLKELETAESPFDTSGSSGTYLWLQATPRQLHDLMMDI